MKAEVTRVHKSRNGALLETSPACVYTHTPGTHTRRTDTLTQSTPSPLPLRTPLPPRPAPSRQPSVKSGSVWAPLAFLSGADPEDENWGLESRTPDPDVPLCSGIVALSLESTRE